MLLIAFLFTSTLLAVAIEPKYIKSRLIRSPALGCGFGASFQGPEFWEEAIQDGCFGLLRTELSQLGSTRHCWTPMHYGADEWHLVQRDLCAAKSWSQEKLYQCVIRRKPKWLHSSLISPASAGCEKKLCLPVIDFRDLGLFGIFHSFPPPYSPTCPAEFEWGMSAQLRHTIAPRNPLTNSEWRDHKWFMACLHQPAGFAGHMFCKRSNAIK